jgi:acetate---CoA ligase (ADP-forming)
MKDNVDLLFNPKSIAVVGVSEEITKLGSVIYHNIIESGYEGELFAVNPKYDRVFGNICYRDIKDIPSSIDLVCFVVPAQLIPEQLEHAVLTKGIKAAMIISAGFKEVGEEGMQRENKIKEIAEKYNIRVLGPNCLGYINTRAKLNCSFAGAPPPEGGIFFLSQSGAFCTAALDIAQKRNMGFNHFVSYGNKAEINEFDLLNYALNSDFVKVVGAYIEEITDGTKVYKLIREKNNKPVIILSPGKSEKAKQAISSHTGSMVRSASIRTQALNQAGAIMVEGMDTMFDLMMAFSWSRPMHGDRVGVITNAGGPGIIATDKIEEVGLKVADFSDETKQKLREVMPEAASVQNPVDVIGDALAKRYGDAIDILMKDSNVDSILVILTPQLITQIEETAKFIINASKVCSKPIIAAFLGGKYVRGGVERLYDYNIPVFDFVEDAVESMAYMYRYYNCQDSCTFHNLEVQDIEKSRKNEDELLKYVGEEQKALPEDLVMKISEEFDIDIPAQLVSSDIEEISKFCADKYPVVIKATTEDIAHKTDLKAIYLNLQNEDELRRSFDELQSNIASLPDRKNKGLASILVQEMITGGEEVFIGINRDGASTVYDEDFSDGGFGHVIVFGKGGIYTEIYKDIDSRLLPLTHNGIVNLVESTKVSQILKGARNARIFALDKVYELVDKIQKLALSYPEIASMDLNPVFVTEKRAVAVDMKIFVGK